MSFSITIIIIGSLIISIFICLFCMCASNNESELNNDDFDTIINKILTRNENKSQNSNSVIEL